MGFNQNNNNNNNMENNVFRLPLSASHQGRRNNDPATWSSSTDSFRVQPGSEVVLLSSLREMRMLHVLGFVPSFLESTDVSINWRYIYPLLLAVDQFNRRHIKTLPTAGGGGGFRLSYYRGDDDDDNHGVDCNVYLTMDLVRYGNASSSVEGGGPSSVLYRQMARQHTPSTPHPAGVIWMGESTRGGQHHHHQRQSTRTLAAQGYQIPFLENNPLDDDGSVMRPSLAATARATIAYLQHLGVTHVAIVVETSGGRAKNGDNDDTLYFRALHQQFLGTDEIVVRTIPGGDPYQAVLDLKETDLRYIVPIVSLHGTWGTTFLEAAYENGLVGSDFVWIWQQGLWRDNLSKTATQALQGSALVAWSPRSKPIDALREAVLDPSFHQLWGEAMRWSAEQNISDSGSWNASIGELGPQQLHPYSRFWNEFYSAYEAVFRLGMAACELDHDFFSGSELDAQIRKLARQREPREESFEIFNLRLGATDWVVVDYSSTAIVHVGDGQTKGNVTVLQPFVYYDGSTTVPLPLAPLQADRNDVSRAVLIVGWLVTAMVMLLTFYVGCRVVVARDPSSRLHRVKRDTLFLAGVLLVAMSIVPAMYLVQGPSLGLDAACLSLPWLLGLGGLICLCSLYNEARESFVAESSMHTEIYDPGRAACPSLLVLMKTGILMAWTFHTPLRWVNNKTDQAVHSVGTCHHDGNRMHFAYAILCASVDLIAVVMTYCLLFRLRKYANGVSGRVFVTLTGSLEICVLGAPVLCVVDNRTAFFLCYAAMTCAVCLLLLRHVANSLSQKNLGYCRLIRQMRMCKGRLSCSLQLASFRRRPPETSKNPKTQDGLTDNDNQRRISNSSTLVSNATFSRNNDFLDEMDDDQDVTTSPGARRRAAFQRNEMLERIESDDSLSLTCDVAPSSPGAETDRTMIEARRLYEQTCKNNRDERGAARLLPSRSHSFNKGMLTLPSGPVPFRQHRSVVAELKAKIASQRKYDRERDGMDHLSDS